MDQAGAIVVVNAGSSSLKFSLFEENGDDLSVFLKGQFEGLYTGCGHFIARDNEGGIAAEKQWQGAKLTHDDAVRQLLDFVRAHLGGRRVEAIGHRIVHGGTEYAGPTLLDAGVLARLERLTPLAPLHQPHNLAPIRAVLALAPQLPQVGCFDTAFHAAQPALAQAFALPAEITDRGVRRYGFHGLSYEYIADRIGNEAPDIGQGRVVVAHLGSGASMCAMKAGRSVETTMGFTALDGVPMGTRPGQMDPGVVLYLIDQKGMTTGEVTDLLYRASGLKGLSGISGDMRDLLASDDPRAAFAIDHFVHRCALSVGMLAAALEGLDAFVFTGGVGENSAPIRARISERLSWLGVELDDAANNAGKTRISTQTSRVALYVLPTDEELMIARHVHALITRP